MRVFAANHIDVQIHAKLIGKRRIKLMRQIGVKTADPTRPDLHVVRKIRPSTQVDDHFRQGFIQRAACFAEAANPLFVAQCFLECLSQSQTDILNSVMIIDCKSPLA